jgi:hypothetical protein
MQQPFVHVGPQTSGRWVILSPYSSEFVADSASRTEAWCKAWIGQHFDSRISVICWWNYTCSAVKLNLMLKWPWPELFLLLHQISQSVVVAEARQSSIWSSAGLEGIWPQTCVSRVCPSVHHGCKPLLRWNLGTVTAVDSKSGSVHKLIDVYDVNILVYPYFYTPMYPIYVNLCCVCTKSLSKINLTSCGQGAVVWRIRRFPGRHEYNLLAEVPCVDPIWWNKWMIPFFIWTIMDYGYGLYPSYYFMI